ncbi:UDP-N-acetylenolpyruvoylglucosamine reductase [Allostella sp. ATCC 35155]|nr:UDP-N-acetylenolpyruvoylglucosamine reductase [Stella sp. ATCC 35155]
MAAMRLPDPHPATPPHGRLRDRLPAVRGRIAADAPLAPVTWFRVGGHAEVLFRPADAEDLAAFLAGCPAGVPVTPVGVASNLLVRDGGIPGVVVRFGRGFAGVAVAGDRITAGAGALDGTVAAVARDAGLGGLEFLSGVPGTVGGALRMNAGCYGREIADVLVELEAVDRAGRRHRVPAAEAGLSYRHCGLPEDWIFLAATFRGTPDDPEAIGRRMAELAQRREATQPIRARTGGSTFANPPGERAWRLIDEAGCRGLSIGGAQVSEKHCNFLVNTGAASAADIEQLGEEVRRRVAARSGIRLAWEIRRIGVPAAHQENRAVEASS